MSVGPILSLWRGRASDGENTRSKAVHSMTAREQRKREQLDREGAGTRPHLHEYSTVQYKEYRDLLCPARP